MDPSLSFWTGAFGLLFLIVTCTALGRLHIRRGHLTRHRRLMTLAGGLTVLFLLAYVIKVLVLGKEDLSTWEHHRLVTLRCHETVVGMMLLSGTAARILAQFPHRRPTWHRLLGRICQGASILSLATAGMVLAGMYGM